MYYEEASHLSYCICDGLWVDSFWTNRFQTQLNPLFPPSSGFFENTSDSYGLQVSGTPVPEPTTIALLGIGLAGFVGGAVKRRFKRVKK